MLVTFVLFVTNTLAYLGAHDKSVMFLYYRPLDKHTSLLRTPENYGRKQFLNIGPWMIPDSGFWMSVGSVTTEKNNFNIRI